MGAATAFFALAGLGIIEEDSAHDLAGDTKKVGAILPIGLALIDQLQIRLMDQRRRLQGMAGALVAELSAGQTLQFVVDKWS